MPSPEALRLAEEYRRQQVQLRAAFLREYTAGRRYPTESLADFLHWSTEREAIALITAADARIKERIASREAPPSPRRPDPGQTGKPPRRSYRDLFPDDDEEAGAPSEPPTVDADPAPTEAFDRAEAEAEYARLAAKAVERGHKDAAKILAKPAAELDDATLLGSIQALLAWEARLGSDETVTA